MTNKFDFQPKLFAALKNYSKEKFMSDLMAGIIVGIVALPLAIAFGIASGVSPEKGLITAIIGGFIVSLLGESGRDVRGWLAARALPIRWAVMIGAAVVILLTGVWGSGFSEASFIYFNF